MDEIKIRIIMIILAALGGFCTFLPKNKLLYKNMRPVFVIIYRVLGAIVLAAGILAIIFMSVKA